MEDLEKPRIKLTEKNTKHYIKQYKLNILSRFIENQIIRSREVIEKVLKKDLLKPKQLKVNTTFNLILKKINKEY